MPKYSIASHFPSTLHLQLPPQSSVPTTQSLSHVGHVPFGARALVFGTQLVAWQQADGTQSSADLHSTAPARTTNPPLPAGDELPATMTMATSVRKRKASRCLTDMGDRGCVDEGGGHQRPTNLFAREAR